MRSLIPARLGPGVRLAIGLICASCSAAPGTSTFAEVSNDASAEADAGSSPADAASYPDALPCAYGALSAACAPEEAVPLPCPATWCPGDCLDQQPCGGMIAAAVDAGGFTSGACAYDAKSLQLVAYVMFGVDTGPWCQYGAAGTSVPVGCAATWQKSACSTRPHPWYCESDAGACAADAGAEDAGASDAAGE